MSSNKQQASTYYFQADANALGGTIQRADEPVHTVRSRASVSLPPVGGAAEALDQNFDHQGILSCAAAYSRVFGTTSADGKSHIHVKSVVEGLNIAGAIRARVLVAELKIEIPGNSNERLVAVGTSSFEGLVIRGCEAVVNKAKWSGGPQTMQQFEVVARDQAQALLTGIQRNGVKDDSWGATIRRYRWMVPGQDGYIDQDKLDGRQVLCSLVDSLSGLKPDAGESIGHVLAIPDVGRFFFGELLVSSYSVQLSMVRAELGCKIHGGASAASLVGGGHQVPPA